MRTLPLAIIGAPFAAWALHGCLGALGAPELVAIVAAILWGMLWLVVAHLGPNARFLRARRGSGRRAIPGGRGVWTGAVLGALFLPLAVYVLALALEWLAVAAAPLTIPLIALLAASVPGALWWMLLFPGVAAQDADVVRPLGWRRFTPHVAAGTIPPRRDARPPV
jgi:hypothetical protein